MKFLKALILTGICSFSWAGGFSGTSGGGQLIYPSTGTPSFPFGISASTGVFSSSVTALSFRATGLSVGSVYLSGSTNISTVTVNAAGNVITIPGQMSVSSQTVSGQFTAGTIIGKDTLTLYENNGGYDGWNVNLPVALGACNVSNLNAGTLTLGSASGACGVVTGQVSLVDGVTNISMTPNTIGFGSSGTNVISNIDQIQWRNGTVQTSSPTRGGYAVEPATVTFNLAKGVAGSTAAFSWTDPNLNSVDNTMFVSVTSSNTSISSSTTRAIVGDAVFYSTKPNTAAGQVGIAGYAENYATGSLYQNVAGYFNPAHYSTGTIIENYGIYDLNSNTSGGLVSTDYGIYSKYTGGSGSTATVHYGSYLASPTLSVGSRITTLYGLYVGAQTVGDTNYGIYSAGGNNVFVGSTSFNAGVIVSSITINNGGSSGQTVCWKTATTLGYCSSIVGAGGACTCN